MPYLYIPQTFVPSRRAQVFSQSRSATPEKVAGVANNT